MESTNKDLVRRFYAQVLNEGDLASLEDMVVDDYVEHDPLPGQGTGRAGLADRVRMLRDGLAGTYTIQDIVAEGDRVVVRWTDAGTHVGEIAGMPATGRSFTFTGIDIYRVADGRLAEHWHVIDMLALLQQLGLAGAP